jgi:hypothetical protein
MLGAGAGTTAGSVSNSVGVAVSAVRPGAGDQDDPRRDGGGCPPPRRCPRWGQPPTLGWRAGREHEHRDDRLGRGSAAVVAGFQRPVPQPLVHREHGGRAVGEHPPAAHRDLTRLRAGAAGRPAPVRPGPAHGPDPALAPLQDVPVVGGQDDDPPGALGAVQQRPQVLHRVRGPLGAAGVGPVQRVVEGVQDARDQVRRGHGVEGGRHVGGQFVPGSAAVQQLLVEQHPGHLGAGAGVLEAALLVGLPTASQPAGQQAGAADVGQRGQDRETGGARLVTVGKHLQPRRPHPRRCGGTRGRSGARTGTGSVAASLQGMT